MFEVDDSFRKSGESARKRRESRRRRQGARLGLVLGAGLLSLALLGGVAAWLLLTPREAGTVAGAEEGFALVQAEGAEDGIFQGDQLASFIGLRRDPMILQLEQGEASRTRLLPGPAAFQPDRAGPPAPDRLALLRDTLFVTEQRLVTTLPSSRADFAMFQAQRSKAIDAAASAPVPSATPVASGTVVRVDTGGSWGDFISGDDGATGGDGDAVYVETRIENTTSVAFAAPEAQRRALYRDEIVVLTTERPLAEVLADNGLGADAEAIAAAAAQELGADGPLEPGAIVALRLRPQAQGQGAALMQMSLYGATGYIGSLAQPEPGRFAASADPWIDTDLLRRSAALEGGRAKTDELRLLDALYSAAIRNGMQTELVGEMIVIMSQRYDLDRFVAEGDRVSILYAEHPGPGLPGLGQLFFIGIDGPSGQMPCYVLPASAGPGGGFHCLDLGGAGSGLGGGGAGGLGGGLIVPVNGVKTSGFGPRHHPILKQVRNHNGVDWAAPTGTPVTAAGDGTVAYAGDGGDYGNVVYIDHGKGVQTRYAHLNAFAAGLAAGQPVRAGQKIGEVGTTGRSTGPHLHFELMVGGRPVDPMTYGGSDISDALRTLVNQIIQVESSGQADARNSRSTATGAGQFIDSTWLRMMRIYRPDLVSSMTEPQLLALRTDPALSREMVTNLARENESFLRSKGHEITPGRLYLAHFLGPRGADLALNADPAATVGAVMGANVVAANPFLKSLTVGDMIALMDRKMSGSPAAPVRTAARLTPEQQSYREEVDAVLASAG